MSAYYDQNGPNGRNEIKIPNIGLVILKVAIGCFVIVVGLDDIDDLTQFLIFVVLGLAFIAWGILPYVIAKKEIKKQEARMILEKPFPEDELKDEAEILAEKYYNK